MAFYSSQRTHIALLRAVLWVDDPFSSLSRKVIALLWVEDHGIITSTVFSWEFYLFVMNSFKVRKHSAIRLTFYTKSILRWMTKVFCEKNIFFLTNNVFKFSNSSLWHIISGLHIFGFKNIKFLLYVNSVWILKECIEN